MFDFGQLAKDFFVLLAQLGGYLDMHLDQQIPSTMVPRIGHPQAAELKDGARLRSRRDFQFALPRERRHLDRGSQSGLCVA